MLRILILSTIVVVQVFTARLALSQVVRYTDERGAVYYVNSPEKAPTQYRSQLQGQSPLRGISKVNTEGKLLYGSHPIGSTKKVEIYVTDYCPYCKRLEDFLKRRKVKYKRYDIQRDQRARQMFEELGGVSVPLTRIDSNIIQGFNSDKLSELLDKDKK